MDHAVSCGVLGLKPSNLVRALWQRASECVRHLPAGWLRKVKLLQSARLRLNFGQGRVRLFFRGELVLLNILRVVVLWFGLAVFYLVQA